MYNQIIIKKFSSSHKYNFFFCSLNIRMVNSSLNLSLNELKLIAEHRNISDYENKSAKDLIKALRGPKPNRYRKFFYDIKNYRYLSELETRDKKKF